MKGAECWVTIAVSDDQAWSAMVLAQSIKNTMSSRPVSVVISDEVTLPLRLLLQQIFDAVLRFDTVEVGQPGYGILWLWNMKIWEKCVFVNANSYLVKNSDELFSKPAYSAVQDGIDEGSTAFDVFVFKPNPQDFSVLKSLRNHGGICDILRKRFKAFMETPENRISCAFVSLPNVAGSSDANIITYAKHLTERISEDVSGQWVSTFSRDVVGEIEHVDEKESQALLWLSIEKHGLPKNYGTRPYSPTTNVSAEVGKLGDSIAVIGMSCRVPGANDPDEFWNLLITKEDPITKFPPNRPLPPDQPDALEKTMEAGFLKCPIDEFDAKFFEISPREAPFVDPQQRLLLEVVWESIESANIQPYSLSETRTGVFVGIYKQDYDNIFPDTGLSPNESSHRYFGNAFSPTASRVSHFLNLQGPNYCIESGSSSSSNAIHLAVQSLRTGETTMGIACGVNLVLRIGSPLGGGLDSPVLSRDFRCKTFDESANGIARAEGCGAVVLKRLETAIRDGDNILALIRGCALNNDGRSISLGTPNAEAQQKVIRAALSDAGIQPNEVSFLEAHGTGTAVGDPIEMLSISTVYSESRTQPLVLGSVKSNIGHCEAAAGVISFIKILLCMKHQKIPPQLHLRKVNPTLKVDSVPAVIPIEVTLWENQMRIAAMSSFSLSGTNVHLIVQQTPQFLRSSKEVADSKRPEMIAISAKSVQALEALRSKYLTFLKSNPKIPLTDFAFTLNTGRAQMLHKIALVAKDTSQLKTKLAEKSYVTGTSSNQKPKIIFLFTGQGSQYFGMAQDLYVASPIFRLTFDQCDALYTHRLKVSLKVVLWKDPALLNQTVYCQPAIFSVQISLARLWESFGILPDSVVGHSIGEFCASVVSGLLSLEDGMKLVIERSLLVNSLPTGKMLVLKTGPGKCQQLIHDFAQNGVEVAAENSPEETVVSGNPTSVKKFAEFCTSLGFQHQVLKASHGFHSNEMDSIMSAFRQVASTVKDGNLNCSYISGTLGRQVTRDEIHSDYWANHLRYKVKFQEAINIIWKKSAEQIFLVEIGPQPILLSLAMANVSDTSKGKFCPSMRKSEVGTVTMLTSLTQMYLAGVEISWKDWYHHDGNKVSLPTYPFQRQKYWFYPNKISEPKEVGRNFPNSPTFHPILGCRLQSPLNQLVFSRQLSLHDFSYVLDHCVANEIILPAAAYLETIMAAGYEEVMENLHCQVSFTVTNFVVEAPLKLVNLTEIQTIVHQRDRGLSDEQAQYNIEIHKLSDENKWKRHASAVFSTTSFPSITVNEAIDLRKVIEGMSKVNVVTVAYEAWNKAGIQFGPKFQSIIRAWRGNGATLSEIAYPEDVFQKYICHPIVLDAMIQTNVFRTFYCDNNGATEIQLQLPVGIKQFNWYSNRMSPTMYILATVNAITLYNEFGTMLASIDGLDFAATTITTFLRALNSSPNDNQKRNFMEEIWLPVTGVTTNRLNSSEFITKPAEFVKETISAVEQAEEATLEILSTMDMLFVKFLLRGIMDCNWHWPEVGQLITCEDWATVAPENLKIVRILRILEKHGYVSEHFGEYRICQSLSRHLIQSQILSGFTTLRKCCSEKSTSYRFTARCNQLFSSVLSRKISPISYLFPTTKDECGAIEFYQQGLGQRRTSEMATSVLLDCVSVFRSNTTGKVLRILEVGAGSGICCKLILEGIARHGIPCDYTFTDISPHFLLEAQTNFQNRVTCSIFDIEQDPLCQGFSPKQFDIIIGVNVVHATANISRTLDNLTVVLVPSGILILGEVFQEIEHHALSFGFLEGWWRFNDGRSQSPFLDGNHWVEKFERANFVETTAIPMFDNIYGVIIGRKMEHCTEDSANTVSKTWGMFSDGSELSKLINENLTYFGRTIIDVSRTPIFPSNLEGLIMLNTEIPEKLEPDNEFCKKLLSLTQLLVTNRAQFHVKPRIVVITRGVYYIGDSSPGNPNAATSDSLVRTFVNEHPDFSVSVIDLDQDEISRKRELEEVFPFLWRKDNEMFKKVKEGKVYVQRVVYSGEERTSDIPFPVDARYQLITKSFTDIEISPVSMSTEPTGTQVLIEIRALGLNFRDLLLILQPDGFSSTMKPIADIAGFVVAAGEDSPFKVGDAVFGCSPGTGFVSHTLALSELLLRKPPQMTLTSAAGVSVACLTVLASLQDDAKLRPGERILIHAATGGVGLFAIQYAKHIGAEIHATAGSRRKQAFLRSIGIKYVYHSRNTKFAEEILENTDNNGVDVVLNSLTGPGFKEASITACCPGGRFAELGRINIWNSTEVRERRPDVKYFVVDLKLDTPNKMSELLKSVEDNIARGVFTGIPHTTFPLRKIRQAFKYFEGVQHIGKVIIRMPIAKKPISVGTVLFEEHLFHAESSYLITGGFGGIGLEVGKWMCSKGASYIILASRNPPSAKAREVIAQLNAMGCHVVAKEMDVGNFADCESILGSLEELRFPTLRGIMHAAGILADAIVENQTWTNFETVFRSKVYGTWNLHQLTQRVDLEFFVVFSSLSAAIGIPGQSNYSAANRFLDSFTHYRNSLGLPATSINSGPWSEVGAAAQLENSLLRNFGVKSFSVPDGVSGIEEIMLSNSNHTIFSDINDWDALKKQIQLGNYLTQVGTVGTRTRVTEIADKSIIDHLAMATPEKRLWMLEEFVEQSVKKTLRIATHEELDRNQNFSELGIDSLMTAELRNSIQKSLRKKQLTINAVHNNRSIRSLATHIATLIDFYVGSDPLQEQLVRQDSILPSDIIPSSIPASKPSEFKNLLLTGATGHLGVNLLHVLQRLNPNLFITCVVRADTSEVARLRLTDKITEYLLQKKFNLQKINVVCGDVSKPQFGLPLDIYSDLAQNVDAVIHCAAKADHLEDYDSGEQSMRTMNVLSTVNVLRFSVTGKTKRLLYASSLLAVTTTITTGELVEEFPSGEDFGSGIHNGYALSKFICDKLMAQAVQRGIPVTVIRYPAIFGNSETGLMPVQGDHFYGFLLTCMAIEKLPSFVQEGIPVMAVDTACEISAMVFLSDMSELGVYNLTSGYDKCGDEVKTAFENAGIKTEYVGFLDWLRIAFDEKTLKKNYLLPFGSLYPLPGIDYIQLHPLATRYGSAEMHILSKKMMRNCPNIKQKILPVCTLIEKHLRSRLSPGTAKLA